jgi:[pyruvate, water dikinase]-phosphate phosphotransferase / [pyruvate, water dikinase] kinase
MSAPSPAPPPARLATYFNVHLVSDSTGETLAGVMRASCAQFDRILPLEHTYYLIRSPKQLDRVLADIEAAPGVVMFTISNDELRGRLETRCRELGVPCVAVLDSVLEMLTRYLGQELNHRIGASRSLDADYFRRIDALNFAMGHDDGQATIEIAEADVILVGVSRTSKTPTCVYLANRGVKAANVPIVPNLPLPEALFGAQAPLVVGLTITPDRLVHVRRNRLATMKENRETTYVDDGAVRTEIINAQKMYERHGWPVIDVSRRSVEETAAAVMNLIAERRRERAAGQPV